MIKRLTMLIVLFSAALASAQAAYFNTQAFGVNPLGQTPIFIPYAQVRVCTTADIATFTTPCAHPASVTDIFGNPLSINGGNFGQLTTDAVGRFNFGCSSNTNYWIQVQAATSNSPSTAFAITCPNTSVLPFISSNNTWLGTNTFSGSTIFNNTATFNNPVIFNGTVTINGLLANSFVCTDGSKNLTSTCPAITNGALQNSSVIYNGQLVSLGSNGNVNNGATAHSIALNEGNGTAITGLTLGAHQVGVGAAGADPVAKTVPDCQDTTGNHLNYTQSTDTFSCGNTDNVGFTAIRVFSVTGCTPASSTDSQCTGSITVSPAFADTSYVVQLTANGNGGSTPNLVVTVNGSLATNSIPYAISCSFSCGTVNAPTIYVTAIHP
jgi:hypothetical protein